MCASTAGGRVTSADTPSVTSMVTSVDPGSGRCRAGNIMRIAKRNGV